MEQLMQEEKCPKNKRWTEELCHHNHSPKNKVTKAMTEALGKKLIGQKLGEFSSFPQVFAFSLISLEDLRGLEEPEGRGYRGCCVSEHIKLF